jgi:hypothetical protein
MLSRTGRLESRSPLSTVIRIRSLEHPESVEVGISQNLSPSGVRLIVKSWWMPNEPVRVESPPDVFRSRACVVYCQSMPAGDFAVGLRLLVPQPRWSQEGGMESLR